MRKLISNFSCLGAVVILFSASGCGFKKLPEMKTQAETSLRNMLVEYRLRADLVPHFIKVATGVASLKGLSEDLTKAHDNAVAMDMPITSYDEKQMYRLQSFQFALSRELTRFLQAADETAVAKNGEYQSLKEQLTRAESRIAASRQKFMESAPAYNAHLGEFPHKWYNKFYYKFVTLPVLENTASQ